MKLLTFQAERFAWKPFQRTLDDAADGIAGDVAETVVVFVHAEDRDAGDERRAKVFRQTLKHVKWIANKRDLKNVVLHSFTHLGAANADPVFARDFLAELQHRLASTGYHAHVTPFGWFCSWELSVYGESLAKVWKEI